MNILDLRRVDEDAPMVCGVRQTPRGTEYAIEPGDMSRYTVILLGAVALAYVGNNCYDARHAGLWLGRIEWSNFHPEKLNPYNRAVLAYLAAIALGQDVPEPEDLACRRKPVTEVP